MHRYLIIIEFPRKPGCRDRRIKEHDGYFHNVASAVAFAKAYAKKRGEDVVGIDIYELDKKEENKQWLKQKDHSSGQISR